MSSGGGASVLLRPVLSEDLQIEGSNLEFRSGQSEALPATGTEARSSDALLLEDGASETSLWLRPAPSHDGRSEGSRSRRIVGQQAEVASGAVSSEAVAGAASRPLTGVMRMEGACGTLSGGSHARGSAP